MSIVGKINNKIKGRVTLSDPEASLLHEIALQPGDHIEIGCLWGGSAIVAALAKKENNIPGHVYSIDFMQGGFWVHGDPGADYKIPTLETILDNIKRFEIDELVTVLKTASNPWPVSSNVHPVSVFIDGGHSFEACLADWNNVKKLKPKYVLFHDYNSGDHPGVKQVVDEYVEKDMNWKRTKLARTMVLYTWINK